MGDMCCREGYLEEFKIFCWVEFDFWMKEEIYYGFWFKWWRICKFCVRFEEREGVEGWRVWVRWVCVRGRKEWIRGKLWLCFIIYWMFYR